MKLEESSVIARRKNLGTVQIYRSAEKSEAKRQGGFEARCRGLPEEITRHLFKSPVRP